MGTAVSCGDCCDFSESDKSVFVSGHVMRCKRASWVIRLWHMW